MHPDVGNAGFHEDLAFGQRLGADSYQLDYLREPIPLAGGALLGLERVGIDPALAGSVLLTTVTDVVGFMAFLGLGTLYLL